MKNNKFSSYSFWIAVTGAVVIFLKNLLQVFGVDFDSTAFETIVVSLCGVLVVLGVLTKDNSSEDEIEENKNLDSFENMVNSVILDDKDLKNEKEASILDLEEENKEQDEKFNK